MLRPSKPDSEKGEHGQDIKRERGFHDAAHAAAAECVRRLQAIDVPFVRPSDYLAEMLKSDQHMQKVRGQIADEQARIQTVEKRKLKQLDRKFNKKAGHQKLKVLNELRAKNKTLKDIDNWKSERKTAITANHGVVSAEDSFDKWLSERDTKTPKQGQNKNKTVSKTSKRDEKHAKFAKRSRPNSKQGKGKTNLKRGVSAKRGKGQGR
eukprot:GHVT01093138.1.p1 GENE.GHVT01093138.1~~GHVT01093138.1.p1  ORF type:complete len:208 (+),score=16.20 GHVT01093138.1:1436-2059(+)